MILDYKEATLSFPNQYDPKNNRVVELPMLVIFTILQCKECSQRSILALTYEQFLWNARYRSIVHPTTTHDFKCNRCLGYCPHFCYNAADGVAMLYGYNVSQEWINALNDYPHFHDARKELLPEQLDKKLLRLMRMRGTIPTYAHHAKKLRFRKERINARLEKERLKIWREGQRMMRRLKENRKLAERHEKRLVKIQSKIKFVDTSHQGTEIGDSTSFPIFPCLGDESVYVCAAMPSDKDNVEVVFLEAQRQRGTKRPFVRLQMQECGDPRYAGAW